MHENELLRMDRAIHAAVAAKEYNRAAEILHYQLLATQVLCQFLCVAKKAGFLVIETVEYHCARVLHSWYLMRFVAKCKNTSE